MPRRRGCASVHGTTNGTGTAVVNDKDDVGGSGHDGCHSTHHTHIHVAAPQRRGVGLFPPTKEVQTLPELLIGSQSLRLAALEAREKRERCDNPRCYAHCWGGWVGWSRNWATTDCEYETHDLRLIHFGLFQVRARRQVVQGHVHTW